MKISICIPTYECNGHGVECLEYSFSHMENQSFKDFDVVISDHSRNDDIKNLCKQWENKLDIKYLENPIDRGSPASNTNNAMKSATGDWIKILNQDDYFFSDESLSTISNAVDDSHNWIATGYLHTNDRMGLFNYHVPVMNPNIFAVNTIGTPSCVMFRNIKPVLEMDCNLKYYYDCEYYYRFLQKNGLPRLIENPTIVDYLWSNSVTSGLTQEFMNSELEYVLQKHGIPYEKRAS
jgi:glycosyltransferase involved in cell wall biosynthesis